MEKKTGVMAGIISAAMIGLLFLSSFLNLQSFRNSYQDAVAKGNASIVLGVVNQLEYTLKYGMNIRSYYGIDEVFKELRSYCDAADFLYIADMDGSVIYQDQDGGKGYLADREEIDRREADTKEAVGKAAEADAPYLWEDENGQNLLLPIHGRDGSTVAAMGMTYDRASMDQQFRSYSKQIYIRVILASMLGVGVFLMLLRLIKKNISRNMLIRIIVPAVLSANLLFTVLSYQVFKDGYLEISQYVADTLETKIAYDIEKVISQGVQYEELYGIETYFEDVSGGTEQIDSVSLELSRDVQEHVRADDIGKQFYDLSEDSAGQSARLVMVSSAAYIKASLNKILINLLVSVVTALMIDGEVIGLILAVLTEKKERSKTAEREKNCTFQPLGIVRGLSFSFAMFQYMATAFVSIVLVSIYEPMSLLGMAIPYELVMSLPLTIQITTSLFTAWLSGRLIGRSGWKPVAVGGVMIMAVGTALAACSQRPYLFLAAQAVIGTGLGLAKTSFDVYAVVVSSEQDMELYTSNANAGIVIGMSCSAAIGAVIAGVLGYAGAYLAMTAVGIGVAVLILLLGENVRENRAVIPEDRKAEQVPWRERIDLHFASYLVFMVLPYFFVMMFVDYFFPVYANSQGVGTEVIGYVFLVYGIGTSYVGVVICNLLSKRFHAVQLMTAFLGLTAVGILAFSINNILLFSVILVLLISISDGVMPSQQFKFVNSVPYTKRMGFTRAVSIEGIFSSAIRGAAPILFGYAMMMGNTGLLVIAVLILICAVLFAVINGGIGKRRKECNET